MVIDNADREAASWRYTDEKPGEEWNSLGFDDSAWAEGKAGFGTSDAFVTSEVVGTEWTTPDLWLRKSIDIDGPVEFELAAVRIKHDEDTEVYVNGKPVLATAGFITGWDSYDVTEALKKAIKPGKNLVAVHVHQTTGGQYVDVGLILDPKEKPAKSPGGFDFSKLGDYRRARWSEEKVWGWYADAGPIAGCNYLPRTAVNMTEMWQKETFDPKTIDQELGWAEKAGYNSLRVFVQYLVWKDDPEGLKQRMDQFLSIADKHGMRVMFIPFCDCAFAGREPYLGKQDEPVPGVHNSGWVPSPGLKRVVDRTVWPDLERYIKDLVGRFGKDRRVLIWDLYNEPGNSSMGEKSLPLVAAAFRWSREAGATQPLTVGAWSDFDNRMSKALMAMSDVVSFHGYEPPEGMVKKSFTCRAYNRPVLCTEWLFRQSDNTFETILPIFAHGQIGGYHWGLVAGRIQTYMPWGSKKGDPMPERWQHDVMHPDGKPYRAGEFDLLRKFREDFRLRPINRRWSKEKISKWYEQVGPIVGCNFLPSTAINSTDIWQAESFDPETIDRELGWAQEAGYNSIRVFLQYIVWKDDPEGLKQRMDQFLGIAAKHGISVMWVPFCDCAFADKEPYLGKQDAPRPGKPNGGWVPSPGLKLVADRTAWPDLKRYIQDIVGRFADDRRVLVWDLYNEPGNSKMGETSLPLSEAVFEWARDAKPSQPLTIAPWVVFDFPMSQRHMQLSDVITFHGYDKPAEFEEKILTCKEYERPIICTEWLTRQHGNTFESILPLFAQHHVGGYHWGLVAGKTQTSLPWGFKPGDPLPKVWQHDVFRTDGKPYDAGEFKLLRQYAEQFRLNRRWSKDKAQQWYQQAAPIRGCNYLPRSATNTTEMWQRETFDPKTIDQELGWAKSVGFNSLRVFVQYLVWEDDPEGLKQRMTQLLEIAEKHGIRVMPVLFDDCAFGYPPKQDPYLGPQGDPRPGEYAPFWTPSPGVTRVADRKAWGKLQGYVEDLVGTFANDRRVLAWDLYNEPKPSSRPLIEASFFWARCAKPSQPLTTCWHAYDLCDVINFHNYSGPAAFRADIQHHQQYGRPLLCSEWLLRRGGNTVANILPILEEERVGWFMWGLVVGRTQTNMHWSSKLGDPIPENWQHDIFHPDGKPYRPGEIELFRSVGK